MFGLKCSPKLQICTSGAEAGEAVRALQCTAVATIHEGVASCEQGGY